MTRKRKVKDAYYRRWNIICWWLITIMGAAFIGQVVWFFWGPWLIVIGALLLIAFFYAGI
jgi:hypothetical protein